MSAIEGFSLLWSRILNSSIWDESVATRVVWITLLAMKNKDGVVRSTFSGLVRSANVTEEECRKAVDIFLAPDKGGSRNEDGRRLRVVEGGWFVINHEKYQYSSEERREYWRRVKAEQRAREGRKKTKRVRKGVEADPEWVKGKLEAGWEADAKMAEAQAAGAREYYEAEEARLKAEMEGNRNGGVEPL